jgi:hypothetical protein
MSRNVERPDAPFTVVNGLSLASSWEGAVGTGGLDGFATGAISADLDGDGSTEAVATAIGYEPTAPGCHQCRNVPHTFVSGLELGGPRLWNVEL